MLFWFGQAVPSLPPRARLAKRKASLLIPSLTPPNPHADAKGASLFVPESSRAFLSSPRTMHEEIRTGPPYGALVGMPEESRNKTTEKSARFLACVFETLRFYHRVGQLID